MINGLSWLNLGNGNIQTRETILSNDYNDLTNKPIIILSGTIQNPIKLWTLETGAYILNGYVQHTIELASEAKGLFTTITAMLIDGKYTISAYVPFWEGLYEYILPSSTSATYSEHQVIDIVSQEDTLILSNEEIYNPTKDYHPSTKKYADDMLSALRNELANMGVNETDINKLKAENRRKDIIIQALLSQNSDITVTIDEEVHNISMDLSIDKGMATINKLEGSTLVNVSKQKEETPLSCKVDTVEKINTVELTQDGVIKPTLQGNTLVNNNAQWNDVVEIGTEIEPLIGTEVEIVDTMGEVDVALEGHTAINVSNRKGGLLATDFADVQSGNYIELKPSEDCGTTLEVEGSTLVNICDQKESIAITKNYTVVNTNHVPLQGEYDGKCRPVVEGNTLVNRNVEYDESRVIGTRINESGVEINLEGTFNSEIEVSLDGHTATNLGTEKGGELYKSFDNAVGNEIELVANIGSKTDVICEGDILVNIGIDSKSYTYLSYESNIRSRRIMLAYPVDKITIISNYSGTQLKYQINYDDDKTISTSNHQSPFVAFKEGFKIKSIVIYIAIQKIQVIYKFSLVFWFVVAVVITLFVKCFFIKAEAVYAFNLTVSVYEVSRRDICKIFCQMLRTCF